MCPNCKVKFIQARFKDLATDENFYFTVHIEYCPECGYINQVWVD